MNWSPLFISLRAAILATFFALVFGLLAAWAVVFLQDKTKKLKAVDISGILDGLFTLPLVLPPTVLGFFLLCIFGTKSPAGRFLAVLGIKIVFNWKATVIAASVVAFPLAYRTIRASFEQIDSSIINAARTLGLPEQRIFRYVMIPSALPGVGAGTILAFARALGEFGATLMLAGDIPGRTETIPIAIWSASYGGEMGKALIWVLIIVAISFICIMAMNIFCTGAKQK